MPSARKTKFGTIVDSAQVRVRPRIVHQTYLGSPEAAQQLHSVSASLSKMLGALKRLAVEMARPGSRLTKVGIEAKIRRWVSASFLSEQFHYQIL